MISCITTAGIGKPGGLEAFIRLAAKHGIGGVDVGGGELLKLVAERGVEGARALLAESQVCIGSISLAAEWRADEATFRRGLPALAAQAEAAASLGCKACCTYVLPSVDEEPARFAARAVRRLRQCARILSMYDMRLGLEFVGPRHLRSKWKNLFIHDMAGMLEFIGAVGEPGAGLLLDAFHWHATGGDLAELENLSAEQIVHVHVNDAPDVPAEEVLDNDRLFPGEGVINLAGFIAALRRIGYAGFVSLEVLSQKPPAGDPDTMAAKAAAAFRRLLG